MSARSTGPKDRALAGASNFPGGAGGSGSTSGTSTPQAGPSQPIDIYRPIASALQKPIAHLLPTQTGPLPSTAASIFNLDPTTFTSRLKNKNILLDRLSNTASQPSALIKGKKLHRGHPEIKKRVREEQEYARAERQADGVEGLRKVKRRLKERDTKSVVAAGSQISYSSLLPLHHLHLSYLTHLLALPPFPTSPIPTPTIPSPYPATGLPVGLSPEGIQSRLSKADLTGLRISVLSARNPSLATLSGIIIEETSSTFRLVTSSSRTLVIPKSGTLFEILIPAYAPPNFEPAGELYDTLGDRPGPVDWEAHLAVCPRLRVLLLGTAFGFRSGDRAGRKFRPAQGGGGGSGWGEEWVKGEWAGVLDEVEKDIEARSGGGTAVEKQKKGKRKRNKGRRKDPPSWGRLEVP